MLASQSGGWRYVERRMTGDCYLDWLRKVAAEVPRRDRLGTARLIDQPARVRARDSVELALPVSLGRPVVGTADPDGSLDVSIETYSVPFPGSPLTFGFDRVESRCHGVTNTHPRREAARDRS
jgi:hypothetical protein